ncbi:MAG: hypothetical protein V2A77_02920 [Pseudomonadota bacterium]
MSPAEYRRYYLLTKLFGLKLDEGTFTRRFRTNGDRWLARELDLLRMARVVRGRGTVTVTPGGMYVVSSMMREFFAALNSLREQYIEKQI